MGAIGDCRAVRTAELRPVLAGSRSGQNRDENNDANHHPEE